jgi:hypothetical protein
MNDEVRHLEDITDDDVTLPLGFDHTELTRDEQIEFGNQATTIHNMLAERGQIGVALIFLALRSVIDAAEMWREEGIEGQPLEMAALTDETAPPAHRADDAGFAMAWIMPLAEDQSTSPAVRKAWLSVLRSLASEVRRWQTAAYEAGE